MSLEGVPKVLEVKQMGIDTFDRPIGYLHLITEADQQIAKNLGVLLGQIGINREREVQLLQIASFKTKNSDEKLDVLHNTTQLLKTTKPYQDRHARFKTWKKYLSAKEYVGPANIAQAYWANKPHTVADVEASREGLTSLFTTYPTNFHLLSPRELAQVICELEAIKKYLLELLISDEKMSSVFRIEITILRQKISEILTNEVLDAALQLQKNNYPDPSVSINLSWDNAFTITPRDKNQETVGFVPADEFNTNTNQGLGESCVLNNVGLMLNDPNSNQPIIAPEQRNVGVILQEFCAKYASTRERARVAKSREEWESEQLERNSRQQTIAVTNVYQLLGLHTAEEKSTIVAPEYADRFVELTHADPHAIMRFVETLINIHWQEHQTSLFWRKDKRRETLCALGFVENTEGKWRYDRPIQDDFFHTANIILYLADALKLEKTETDKTSVVASDLGMLILRAHSAYSQGATSIALAKCRNLKAQVEKTLLGALAIKNKAKVLQQQLLTIGSSISSTSSFVQQTTKDVEMLLIKQDELAQLGVELERITGTIKTSLTEAEAKSSQNEIQSSRINADMLRLSSELKVLQAKIAAHEEGFAKLKQTVEQEYQEKLQEQKAQELLAAKLSEELTVLKQEMEKLTTSAAANADSDRTLVLITQKHASITKAAEAALKKLQIIQIRLAELNLILDGTKKQVLVNTDDLRHVLETCAELAAEQKAYLQFQTERNKLLQEAKAAATHEEELVARLNSKQQAVSLSASLLQSDVSALHMQQNKSSVESKAANANADALVLEATQQKNDVLQMQTQTIALETTLRNIQSQRNLAAYYYEGLTPRAISYVGTIIAVATGKQTGATREEVAQAKAIAKVCAYLYHREITPGISEEDQITARNKRENILLFFGEYLAITSNGQTTIKIREQRRIAFSKVLEELQRRRMEHWYDFSETRSWGIYKNTYADAMQKKLDTELVNLPSSSIPRRLVA